MATVASGYRTDTILFYNYIYYYFFTKIFIIISIINGNQTLENHSKKGGNQGAATPGENHQDNGQVDREMSANSPAFFIRQNRSPERKI